MLIKFDATIHLLREETFCVVCFTPPPRRNRRSGSPTGSRPDGDGHLDPVGLAGGHAGRLVHLGPIAVLLVGPGIHESPGVGAGLFLQLRPDLALGGLAGIALYPGAEVRRPARDVQRAVGIADV